MAKGGKDEHKMLFDLQGKRRNVVKVVYAVLALLMGLSLLLVAGPLPFGDIFGAQDAQEQAAEQFEDQQQRIEVKLRKDPDNPELLLALARAHVSAGSNLVDEPAPGQIAITLEARQQYQQASSIWDEYLKATDEPSAGAAQLMSNTLLQLAETASTGAESESNIKAAAEAQKIVADQRPTVGSLGTLAIYTLFSLEYDEAKRINEEARKFAGSRIERQQLDKRFEETEARAKEFAKSLKEEEQLSKAAQEAGGQGEGGGAIQNPFSLGGGAVSE